MAEDYASYSPYNYVLGNPVMLIDPDGRAPDCETCKEFLNATASYLEGALNAIGSNLVLGAPGTRANPQDWGAGAEFAQMGQKAGDILSAGIGSGLVILSAIGVAGEGVLAIPSGGTSALAIAPTAAVGTYGALVAETAVVQMANNQGSGTGRGRNNRTPDPEATGDHSVSNSRGSTTFEKNNKNPSGFQEVKRVDTQGASHGGVQTPHVHERNASGKKIVRPANSDEIPTDLSGN